MPSKRPVAILCVMDRQLLGRPKLVWGGAIGLAVLGAVALIAASLATSGGSSRGRAAAQVPSTARPFAGLAQRGAVLGSPAAPVTLVEYADLQCPFCGAWAREQLPLIVDQLVRTGRLRLRFHGLAFVGPDSQAALAGALAAGRQNRLWDFVDLMYASQGEENSGWVADWMETAAAGAGVVRTRWDADRASGPVVDAIDGLSADAAANGVTSTPSFAIGRTGGPMRLLPTHSLDPAALRVVVDRLAAA
jgi:protein-disulfide isomerase